MYKRILLVFLLFISLSGLKSQQSMDFGLNIGATTYIGEIGNAGSEGFRPFIFYTQPSMTNLSVGGFYRYQFTYNIAAKFNMNWVRVAGADSLSKEPPRVGRNLSFRTDIFEFSVTGEYNFFNTSFYKNSEMVDFAAYGFAGLGYMIFNPTALYEGSRYDLRSLATEGIENQYGMGTLIIPLGVGAHFTINKRLRMGMEFSYRFTFTDYIDDISTYYADASELPFQESKYFANRSLEAYQRGGENLPDPQTYDPGSRRGNPDKNDGYFTAAIQVSYVLNLSKNVHRLRINHNYKRRKNGIKRKKYWK